MMFQQIIPAFKMVLLLTVVTGFLYPGAVTGICQLIFHSQANGNLVVNAGEVRGSSLLAQGFSKPEYFHPRPSAAGPDGYDPTQSTGSNLGPTSQKLFDRLKASSDQFRKENPDYKGAIPADALTASGSGLDPDISIANAKAQALRIAKARGVQQAEVDSIIGALEQGRDLGFLGEPRINVLKLNIELDQRFAKH